MFDTVDFEKTLIAIALESIFLFISLGKILFFINYVKLTRRKCTFLSMIVINLQQVFTLHGSDIHFKADH